MALAADRDTPVREGTIYRYPVLAAVKIYKGALVVLTAEGYAKPAVTGLGLKGIGRSNEYKDNTLGSSGDLYVDVQEGVFKFANGSTSLTIADVGNPVYAVDDQTVHRVSGGTRSAVGTLTAVDSDGVWVSLKNHGTRAISGRFFPLNIYGIDLDDEGTRTYYVSSPVAGTITSISATTYGASTAGANAVLTTSIGNTAITGGAVTIASGSAANTQAAATPTAANVVAVGDLLTVVVTGAQTADSNANLTILVST